MASVKPFSPEDALRGKLSLIPEEMIQAVNEILAEKFNNSSFIVTQDEIIDRFLLLTGYEYTKQDVFNKHWLDFEQIYRDAGWSVYYDKPGYNENYTPSFKFEKKR